MDSFELTKIAGAVLAALLLIFGAKTVVEMRTAAHVTDELGYSLSAAQAPAEEKTAQAKDGEAAAPDAGKDAKPEALKDAKVDESQGAKPDAQPKTADAAAPPAGGGGDVVALLAKANADNGKAAFAKCKSCHVAEKGKASTVGPNLWGVVNRPKGSLEGFKYSEAMKAKGGNWTFEDLSQFIRNPKGYVAGTKMVFAGIADPATEADIIAYLATLADAPVPLPK